MIQNNPRPVMTEERVRQAISFLNHSFKDAVEKYKSRTGDNKNVRGTNIHGYQTNFAYILNEIQRGPIFFVSQNIASANEIINSLNAEQKKNN